MTFSTPPLRSPADNATGTPKAAVFTKILVANRGEIALRVMRTAQRLGIRTVAIHTPVDARAPHVRAADEAVEVPSYLDVEAVVAAAVRSGAQAIHPGYGFLSENAGFARAIADAGLVFVGPTPEVIDAMGRKDRAREIAEKAHVPVVPRGETAGLPVLVKAAAGGGGKGMRIVRKAEELEDAKLAAAREALSAFGDDTLLLEKYVESGRHIEVQVMADNHGHVVHLYERDCSVQRRHQKVLEEAPAPTLTPPQRQRVTSAAVALAREVGYTGAGTVEFLLDNRSGEVYFLEMNTRLQVEHPVTEAVVRVGGQPVDLVELQLRVAAGEELGFGQTGVTIKGHAIEARVYAEDAYAGFLPQAGTATKVVWPSAGGFEARSARTSTSYPIRVDHALEDGQVVSTSYDPMLGKVIAFGETREAARLALADALDGTAILGLTTNVGFLRELVASEDYKDALLNTSWLDRVPPELPEADEARGLAAWAWFRANRAVEGPFRSDGFRLGGVRRTPVVVLDEPVELPLPAPGELVASADAHAVEIVHRGQRWVFERPDPTVDHGPAAGDGTLVAPMPGTMLAVDVATGDQVEEGQRLGVLEAMKMEVALKAPFAGTVTHVGATAGGQVPLKHLLFQVDPPVAG